MPHWLYHAQILNPQGLVLMKISMIALNSVVSFLTSQYNDLNILVGRNENRCWVIN